MRLRQLLSFLLRLFPHADTVQPPQRDGDSSHTADDIVGRYRAAFESLPETQRRIFILHRIEGQSIPAIAEAMTMTTPEVEWQLGRAISALTVALDDGR